jgi:hypothetical protein
MQRRWRKEEAGWHASRASRQSGWQNRENEIFNRSTFLITLRFLDYYRVDFRVVIRGLFHERFFRNHLAPYHVTLLE